MSGSQSRSETSSLLLNGAGVAAISLGGYFIAYAYELGYGNFFGIPSSLIRLNLVIIFASALGLFWLILCVGGVLNAIYPLLPKRGSHIFRGLVHLAPVFVVYLPLLFIYANTPRFWFVAKLSAIWLALLLFVEFVWPLITQRGKATYIGKLEAQKDLDIRLDDLMSRITSTPKGLAGVRLVLGLALLFYFSYALGQSAAMRQKSFLLLGGKEDVALLRIYNGKFIGAHFDRKTKKIDRTLIILDTSQQNELRLIWEKIGPLTLAEETPK
jgi:hypothetical protein